MNIVVVDNFYQDPNAVRKVALNAGYIDVTQLNYPGYQSTKTYSSRSLEAKFEKILERPLDIQPSSQTFGKFRIMLKESGSRLKVHVDGACDWTGVLYLNPPENCHGGTAFYRHKRTGLDGPPSPEKVKDYGFDSWEELESSIIEPDSLRSDAWEESAFVGMKFNRLVLFRGNQLFHCHTESFGTDQENGRMTQNFFFREKAHA